MASKRKSRRPTKKKSSQHGRESLQNKLNDWTYGLRGKTTHKQHIARPARAVPPQTPRNSMMTGRKRMTFGVDRSLTYRGTRGKWLGFLENEDDEVKEEVKQLEIAIDEARRKDAEHQWRCQNEPKYALDDSELKEYTKKETIANKKIQEAEQKINALQTKVGTLDKTLLRLQQSKDNHVKEIDDLEIKKQTEIQQKNDMLKPSETKCAVNWPNLKLLHQQTRKELKRYVASALGPNIGESSEQKSSVLPTIAEGKKRKKKRKKKRTKKQKKGGKRKTRRKR